ncbi:LOG family protein [Ketobacter sp. MCCC 1A13808]|uniref:nucleotide 5'-monophosphate nucleosidase PpnN n=1 Tax=Ketobacter sp. MCCC 1A13808 TaxID=2602738 RepID=UPI000F1374E9|nr:nucleotide 5'-monophosphate nucleosidase PpnN [Ketobacter sp. MCCC 1A13808]MVF10565.1 LOG family protein [Ketobacter sp. MCCC 1A13808]RLP55992.1 MAG: LOG family protein [Ketobacter sp.]
MTDKVASTTVSPEAALELLSPSEVNQLVNQTDANLFHIFRRCALAVLNTGNNNDNTSEILEEFADFDIRFIRQARGIKLQLSNSPATAFVDGKMIRGIREQLFSVLRDVVYITSEIRDSNRFDLTTTAGITDAVFHILRNANAVRKGDANPLVVCWGGHSISREEYDFTKEVGYELGLRDMNIITGCGPGAMKGPMKGAAIGHAKQHVPNRRYVGITEPGIIAAESPNPIVNELIILPDIEKRLEAFVRMSHSVIVFPGGAGTAEEILYILGVLLHPSNEGIPFPLIFAASQDAAPYFDTINQFIAETLGQQAQLKYKIVIGDAAEVAKAARAGAEEVLLYRRTSKDAFYFNWKLNIPNEMQMPFEPTHESMSQLDLHKNQPSHILAANLRKAFSGIVAGNVKEQGITLIREHGPFEIKGDTEIMNSLDKILRTFVIQKRMKIGESEYQPCYRVVT